jgi:predicted acetyltransferase
MKLVKPSVKYKKSYLRYLNETDHSYGLHHYLKPEIVINNFSYFVEIMLDGEKIGKKQKEYFPIFAPFVVYWLIDDNDNYVGRINFRRKENRFKLRNIVAGDIGYEINQEHQGKGYGSIILKLGLDMINFKEKEFEITCLETNIASKKIIEKNGGIFKEKKKDSANNIKLVYTIFSK